MAAPNSQAISLPAPGASTFGTKGSVYLGARSYYDEAVPGGTPAICTALREAGDTALATFLEQPFMSGPWYDVLPIVAISECAARVRGVSHAQLVRDNAAWVAHRDLHGPYRMLLSLAHVETVALRLASLSMRYFDFGGADAAVVRDCVVESHRYGIPAPLAPWFIYATEGFVRIALKLAGATFAGVRYGPPRPEGMLSGIPLVRLRFEISWR